MADTRRPVKVASANTGFAAVLADAAAAGAAVGAAANDRLLSPWRAYAVAVGQSAPANVNRANRAIRAIRGSTR